MPGSLHARRLRRHRGARQPDGRGDRAHRRDLARQRQRDRRSPRSSPTRSAASSSGSGSSRATPRPARGASGTTARGASSSAARRRTSRRGDIREKMLRGRRRACSRSRRRTSTPADGRIFVQGAPDRSVAFEEVAREVYRHPHGRTWTASSRRSRRTRHFKIGERLPPAREAGPLQRVSLVAERRGRVHRRGRPGDGLREDPALLPGRTTRARSSTRCSPTPTSTAGSRRGSAARCTSRSPTTRRRSR